MLASARPRAPLARAAARNGSIRGHSTVRVVAAAPAPPPSKNEPKKKSAVISSASLAAAAAAVVTTPLASHAADAAAAAPEAAVDGAVNSVVEVVKATGSGIKAAISAAASAASAAQSAYKAAEPTLKAAADAAAPALRAGADLAGELASPLVKGAVPLVKAAGGAADDFLASQGVSAAAATAAARQAAEAADAAINGAAPVAGKAAAALAAAGPVGVAQGLAAAVVAALVAPSLFRALLTAARGYAGDVSAAAALDAVVGRGSSVLVDIRSQRDKEAQGVPDLPGGARLIEVELAAVGDRRLRGSLRDASAAERQLTALQISSLRRVSKGTPLLLLDSRGGGDAKAVARELRSRGFGKAFVVSGGFGAWQSARLKTKPAATVSRVEVLPAGPSFGLPLRQLKGGSGSQITLPGGREGTGTTTARRGGTRSLPSGRKGLPSGR